jgi:hypothetical protein
MPSDSSHEIASIARELDLILFKLESELSKDEWREQRAEIRHRLEEAIRALENLSRD